MIWKNIFELQLRYQINYHILIDLPTLTHTFINISPLITCTLAEGSLLLSRDSYVLRENIKKGKKRKKKKRKKSILHWGHIMVLSCNSKLSLDDHRICETTYQYHWPCKYEYGQRQLYPWISFSIFTAYKLIRISWIPQVNSPEYIYDSELSCRRCGEEHFVVMLGVQFLAWRE